MNSSNKKGGLFAGVISGILMILIGTVLLWWNEGNNVRNIRTTNEIEKTVVEIVSDSDPAQYAGQLVAVGGRFTTVDKSLTDDLFTVSVHTPALRRVVEMYQWEEDSDTDSDGDTTYTYEKVWKEGLIDSSNFHRGGHENPTSSPYDSEAWYADKVTLGKYTLSSPQIEQITANRTFSPDGENLKIPDGFTLSGKWLTNAADLDKPEIGDIRLSWKYNDWKELSLIATVSENSFVSYVSSQGKKVNYVTEGNRSAAEMIADMRAADKALKWVMRLFGAVILVMGYFSLISPLTKIASFVPLLGNVINGALFVVVFLIGMTHSLLIIAIAWFRFRPLLGILLIAACAGMGFAAHLLMNKRRAAVTA